MSKNLVGQRSRSFSSSSFSIKKVASIATIDISPLNRNFCLAPILHSLTALEQLVLHSQSVNLESQQSVQSPSPGCVRLVVGDTGANKTLAGNASTRSAMSASVGLSRSSHHLNTITADKTKVRKSKTDKAEAYSSGHWRSALDVGFGKDPGHHRAPEIIYR